jgi:hypothetical protein
MKKTLIALSTAAMLASGAAFAGTTPISSVVPVGSHGFVAVQHYDHGDDRLTNINEREARIRDRINRGINDGRITRREANQLYRQLADVEAKERAFRADGRIGGRESRELMDDLDRLAENVRHQLRDEQRY